MEWQFIVALVVAIPIILFPVAYVWYLNIGGIYAAIREARWKRTTSEKGIRAVAEEQREEGIRAVAERPRVVEVYGKPGALEPEAEMEPEEVEVEQQRCMEAKRKPRQQG